VRDDHAIVPLGEYNVPLIGIPKTAVLEECDLCHEEFRLSDVELIGYQILCRKCRSKFK
jgi:hypothetical protein